MNKVIQRWTVKRKEGSKPFWRKVGHVAEFEDGSMKLNLYMFPEEFYIFRAEEPDKEKVPNEQE